MKGFCTHFISVNCGIEERDLNDGSVDLFRAGWGSNSRWCLLDGTHGICPPVYLGESQIVLYSRTHSLIHWHCSYRHSWERNTRKLYDIVLGAVLHLPSCSTGWQRAITYVAVCACINALPSHWPSRRRIVWATPQSLARLGDETSIRCASLRQNNLWL